MDEKLRIAHSIEGRFLRYDAYLGERHVGYCNCELKSETEFFLADLHVEKRELTPWFPWWKRWFKPRIIRFDFRNKGIGSQLLKTALQEARRREVKHIHGYIVQDGIDESPFLLSWYQRLGFEVCEADGKQIVPAVKMIKMKL